MRTLQEINSEILSKREDIRKLMDERSAALFEKKSPVKKAQILIIQKRDADLLEMVKLFCAGSPAQEAARIIGRDGWWGAEVKEGWRKWFPDHYRKTGPNVSTLRLNPPPFSK